MTKTGTIVKSENRPFYDPFKDTVHMQTEPPRIQKLFYFIIVNRVVIRRFLTVLIAFAATAAVVICLRMHFSDEPTYQGKKLTAWLIQLNVAGARATNEANDYVTGNDIARGASIEQAVIKIGTNGVPTLLKMLANRNTSLTDGFVSICPDRVRYSVGLLRDDERVGFALFGFAHLGKAALPAVPSLVRMLDDACAEVRENAAAALAAVGPSASDAVPALLEHIYDTNVDVQNRIKCALGEIHSRPEIAVPILIESLEDSRRTNETYLSSVYALGQYRESASPAIPQLTRLLNSCSNVDARFSITSAIQSIRSE